MYKFLHLRPVHLASCRFELSIEGEGGYGETFEHFKGRVREYTICLGNALKNYNFNSLLQSRLLCSLNIWGIDITPESWVRNISVVIDIGKISILPN